MDKGPEIRRSLTPRQPQGAGDPLPPCRPAWQPPAQGQQGGRGRVEPDTTSSARRSAEGASPAFVLALPSPAAGRKKAGERRERGRERDEASQGLGW
jgi:hypothetical protein